MIVTPKPKALREHHLFPSAMQEHDEESFVLPALLRPEEIISKIRRTAECGDSIENLVKSGSCSVDIRLTDFYDPNGELLRFPFDIPYGGIISGHSELLLYDHDNLYCVETRSTIARKGLVCIGFKDDELALITKGSGARMFQEGRFMLNFFLRNYNPNTLTIEKPFSPIQITATRYEQGFVPFWERPLKLYRNGKDVTRENIVALGKFMAYKVHLCSELLVPKECSSPISVLDNDMEAQFERRNVKDIFELNPPFCLTLTDEEVHTNGQPAYMFPFHYLEAVRHHEEFETTSGLAHFAGRLFSSNTGLPVTGNAGVLNPTGKGRVVCENITAGRNLRKYFQPEQPFALIIPVSFQDNGFYASSESGEHDHQRTITF